MRSAQSVSPAVPGGATGQASGTISGVHCYLSWNISATEFPCQSSARSHLPGQFGMTWSGCCSGHQTCHGVGIFHEGLWGENESLSKDRELHMWPHGGHVTCRRQGKKCPAEHSEACRSPMAGTGCIFSGEAFTSPANPPGLGT